MKRDEELERLKARVGDLEARPRSSNSHQAPPPSISPNIIVNVPGGPYTTSPQNMGQSPTPSPHASVNGLENLDSTQRRRGWEEGNGMQEDTHGKAASDAAYIKTLEGALEEVGPTDFLAAVLEDYSALHHSAARAPSPKAPVQQMLGASTRI
eukprot:686290-Pelagomonas_calceolata.AAC.3